MLGTVTALPRYPVKSMLGEDLDASDVSHRGLARDRRLAVVSRRDRQGREPEVPAAVAGPAHAVRRSPGRRLPAHLPDWKTVCSTGADVDAGLSALLTGPSRYLDPA